VPLRAGSEEYLDSEKYELKERGLDGPLFPLVRALNEARRAHPALQRLDNLTFLETLNDELIAYAKREGDDAVVVVVNLDPHGSREGLVSLPAELGLPDGFTVRDLLTGRSFAWTASGNYVGLPPGKSHVLTVE
jgi:starch synthase (maltosyl-transferring)